MAQTANSTRGSGAAIPFYKRAIELDPGFAAAYAWLARMYGDTGELDLANENTRRAWELRARASDQERFMIEFSYDRNVTGNLLKARQALEMWAQAYPRDPAPHSLLAGCTSGCLGRFERGEQAARRAVELGPNRPFAYTNLATHRLFLGRVSDAEAALQTATEHKIITPEVLELQYQIAFLKGDPIEMKRVLERGKERAEAEDAFLNLEAATLGYYGRFRESRAQSQSAVEVAIGSGAKERAGQHQAALGVREALAGNNQEAGRAAKAALALSRNRSTQYLAAVALALIKDAQGGILANELDRKYPEDTLVRSSYLPALRGVLELNRHAPESAMTVLQANVPYELGCPGADWLAFSGALLPVYVRGEALLAAQRGADAAVEFQKIITHRAIVFLDLTAVLAYWKLGRAWAMAGDLVKAKAAYEEFLKIWKDADRDIPVFKQAQAEYAQLRAGY